jgi:tetratricopeptide (TPR) repeat protein
LLEAEHAAVPDDPAVRAAQAALARARQDWAGALRHYDAVLAAFPDHLDALAARADTLFERGDATDKPAVHDAVNLVLWGDPARPTLRPDPRHPLALVLKADCLRRAGEYPRACRYYDRALARGVGARAILGKAEAQARDGHLAAALRTLQRLGDDSSATTWRQRGFVYLAASDYDAAVTALDKALAIDPENGYAHAGRGEAHRKCHAFTQAVQDFDRALRLDPFHGPTWDLATAGLTKARTSRRKRLGLF